jgi:hypothetical protein
MHNIGCGDSGHVTHCSLEYAMVMLLTAHWKMQCAVLLTLCLFG